MPLDGSVYSKEKELDSVEFGRALRICTLSEIDFSSVSAHAALLLVGAA